MVERAQKWLVDTLSGMSKGDVKYQFIDAMSTEMDLQLNSFGVFAHFESMNPSEIATIQWPRIKYFDDGISAQMIKVRITRKHLEAFNLGTCCFRAKGECDVERKTNGNRCSLREAMFEERRRRRRAAPPEQRQEVKDERKRERQDRALAAKAMREEAERQKRQRLEEQKSFKPCKHWLAGKCKRALPFQRCGRVHVQGVPQTPEARVAATRKVDCVGFAGGSNYVEGEDCPYGGQEECPYNHELGPSPGGEAPAEAPAASGS